MTYTTKISKQGNSLGIRVPKDLLDSLGLVQGDEVTMTVNNERLEVLRANDDYNFAMALGRECASRYRHALAKLAQ